MELDTLCVTILILDSAEKRWLQAVMQHPLNGLHPEAEEPFEREMRTKLFLALRDDDDDED